MKQGDLMAEPVGDHHVVTTSPIGRVLEERVMDGGVIISANPMAYFLS